MESAIKKLRDRIERMNNNLFFAFSHFVVWESLKKSTDPNVVGDNIAKENVLVLNRFISFFLPTLHANRKVFSIELSKLYDIDKRKQSLTLQKLINFARSNKKDLNKDALSFNKGTTQNLASNYQGITEEMLNNCETMLRSEGNRIQELKKFRDTKLAHEQIKEENISLVVEDMEKLFQLASEILNKISLSLYQDECKHFDAKGPIQHATTSIINYLRRKFEP